MIVSPAGDLQSFVGKNIDRVGARIERAAGLRCFRWLEPRDIGIESILMISTCVCGRGMACDRVNVHVDRLHIIKRITVGQR